MMLLALQYAVQPRLSRKFIPKEANKQHVALVEELVKTGMAALMFLGKAGHIRQQAVKDWTLSSSLAVAGLPAALYALQGVLQYQSHQHLDSLTFNGLSQTKTLSTAFGCYLVLGKAQSSVQMVALLLLLAAAWIFQGQRFQPSADKQSSDWWILGVAPCIGAAMLSGLAGALSQKGLQLTGISGRDPFLYTLEISFYSALVLLFNILRSSGDATKKPTTKISWKHAIIPITCKAAGGVITALVHKYAGSVAKGFALMVGLVLSTGLSVGQVHEWTATLLIMLSTWLHFTHPPK
jgi:UDP-sugar transporter A1/2/3